jgi:hypothetical protein
MESARYLPLLRVLADHEVEFILVGGLAAVLQGAPIVTGDLDIVHRRTPENVAKLLSALGELEAVYRIDRLKPTAAHLSGPGHALLSTKFCDLDVLGTIFADTDYEGLRDDALEVELADVTIEVLSLERLIQSKEYARRGKDLAVLPALRAALEQCKKRCPLSDRAGVGCVPCVGCC